MPITKLSDIKIDRWIIRVVENGYTIYEVNGKWRKIRSMKGYLSSSHAENKARDWLRAYRFTLS